MTSYGIVLETEPGSVEREVVTYQRPDGSTGRIHLLRPRSSARNRAALPVVVMAAATRQGSVTERPQYVTWARALGEAGIATALFESSWGTHEAEIGHVFSALAAKGPDWGLRPDAIGAFAASGNVMGFYDEIADPHSKVRCAALYYGAPETATPPTGMSMLLVSAGRDAPGLNARIGDFARHSMDAGDDVEWIHYADGHHAFDILDDTDRSRAIIARTVDFFVAELTETTLASPGANRLRKALSHYAYQEWESAADAYRAHLQDEPEDLLAWHRLGRSEMEVGRFAASAVALTQAAAGGHQPQTTYYDAACMAALAGDPAQAIGLLESAMRAGYDDRDHMRRDPDLVSLAEEPGFKRLLEERAR